MVCEFSSGFVASRRRREPKRANFSQAEGWNEVAGFRANLDAKESVMTGRPGDRSPLAPVGDPAGNLSGSVKDQQLTPREREVLSTRSIRSQVAIFPPTRCTRIASWVVALLRSLLIGTFPIRSVVI